MLCTYPKGTCTDENLRSLGQRAGGHDQARGLGDGHEVAGDVPVGDRDGPSLTHPFEQGCANGYFGPE